MVKKTTYGSVKRLGARYGRTVKFKLGKIETEQRKKHKCPYCNYAKVRRKALGIWHCSKCGATFTNKAYTVGKLGSITKPAEERGLPQMPEEETKEIRETKELQQEKDNQEDDEEDSDEQKESDEAEENN